MPSMIDPTVPVAGVPTTQSVRNNFAIAADELGRAVMAPADDDAPDMELPAALARASGIMGFDSLGQPTVGGSFQALLALLAGTIPGLPPLAYVASRAALRALGRPPDNAAVLELGYTAPGDKTSRTWSWYPSSIAADDNGSVVIPNGQPPGTPGRWTLGPDNGGFVHLQDFGPVGHGGDDTAAMQAALATGCNVHLPAATLNFNTATGGSVFLIGSNDQTIQGAGTAGRIQPTLAGTVIQSTASGAILFHFQGANAARIRDLLFNCPAMTDGWCVFFDNCGPMSSAENLNFLTAPGLIAKGNAGAETFTRNIRAASGINGGSVALLDGTASTLRAAIYGFGTAAQAGNSGPWLIEDVVIGAGAGATPSIGFYLNGACDSVAVRSLRINTFDIGVCLADYFGIATGNHPMFFVGYDIEVQTPGCTLFGALSAGFQINHGVALDFIGQTFCNASGGHGLLASAAVADLKVDGIRFNGCAKDCVYLQCTGAVISRGSITAAVNGSGNSGSANIHIGGNASNIVIANIIDMGIKAGDTGYDLNIAPGAANIKLIGNAWTGGRQPTLINDPSFIGEYFPSIRQTWTPTFTFTTAGTSSWTYTLQEGYLWRNGNFIEYEVNVAASVNAYTGASGNLTIRGMPAAPTGSGFGNLPATIGRWSNLVLDTGFTQLAAEPLVATPTTIALYEQKSAGASQQMTVANAPPSTANISIHLAGRYQTS